MKATLTTRLRELGFALPAEAVTPTLGLVRGYEEQFGLTLPKDYRTFLSKHAGVRGLASCPLLEPTPFGNAECIDYFFGFEPDGLADATELIEGAPDVVALGYTPLGRMFWLFCAEPYRGHVFVHDHYGRSAWPDDEFRKWPNLAPEIHHYLDLRRTGRLPPKPPGFENLYLAARSFTEFVERLEPYRSE
ncbi:SMI1/KNR4 family protein [Urbifossiella limnaea]|uniref:Knr4/Smi1-like domain-containing protein n=1 Tax=Urbifossiella limnaea TaxID=2528023 RepID=A0A517XT93_9BACT|nr:SMI1/KNR4 family protein [Urbifossiella limnaea]QDU20746.1 hypothetical protein ETAA1_27060 [Urbifossiella limnaea]